MMLQLSTANWITADLSDSDFAEMAHLMLSCSDITMLPGMLAAADRHTDLWMTDDGQLILIHLLQLLLDTLNEGHAREALAAMDLCPPRLAQQAQELFLAAFCPDSELDPAKLDDAAILCFSLLIGASGQRADVGPFLTRAGVDRCASIFGTPAAAIAAHFTRDAERVERFKAKLIIWDLDDTLWQGTLADGHMLVLNEKRVGYVRALNRHGIVSAICSKNDFAIAKATLDDFRLWDEFVFSRIAFVPKGEVVKQMIADMQLRAVNVLFVDDNIRNLEEVSAAVPGIRVMDATTPECDALLEQILADNAHVEKSRIADYRLLETRVTERQASSLSDEAFLLQSGIHATYTHRMDSLAFAERIEELINRSNQLNYTQSRVEPGSIETTILNITDYHVACVFAWDNYGYYGLVGVAICDRNKRKLLHFALSCRIMHMGLEDFLFKTLSHWNGDVDLSRLAKPLPAQSSRAITAVPFEDMAIRQKILAAEAPRDWSKVQIRVMADCQSGAFYHYSRFSEEMDFDNLPRVFVLPMMLTGVHCEQSFPKHLVYTPSTDYMDYRWQEQGLVLDDALYETALTRFIDEIVLTCDRKLLALLPPANGAEKYYDVWGGLGLSGIDMRERHQRFNALWRDLAARYPDRINCIDLEGLVSDADMMQHAWHFVPSALQRVAGLIDNWYESEKTSWRKDRLKDDYRSV